MQVIEMSEMKPDICVTWYWLYHTQVWYSSLLFFVSMCQLQKLNIS